jgi:hypothetical protein
MSISRHPWSRLTLSRLFLTAFVGAHATMTVAAPPAPAAEPPTRAPFVDVPRDHWAYEAVEELRQRGILLGYPPAPERPAMSPARARRQARPAPPSPGRRLGNPDRQRRQRRR